MLLNKIRIVLSHHHLGIYNTFQALALIFKCPLFFFEKLSSFRNEGVLKLSQIIPSLSLCETMSLKRSMSLLSYRIKADAVADFADLTTL